MYMYYRLVERAGDSGCGKGVGPCGIENDWLKDLSSSGAAGASVRSGYGYSSSERRALSCPEVGPEDGRREGGPGDGRLEGGTGDGPEDGPHCF